MTTVREYFEDSDCYSCVLGFCCSYKTYTGGHYMDPACACIDKADLDLEIDDYIAKIEGQQADYIDKIRKEEARQEEINRLKEEKRAKQRAYYWKNRNKIKERRREKINEARKQARESFINSMKEFNNTFGQFFN